MKCTLAKMAGSGYLEPDLINYDFWRWLPTKMTNTKNYFKRKERKKVFIKKYYYFIFRTNISFTIALFFGKTFLFQLPFISAINFFYNYDFFPQEIIAHFRPTLLFYHNLEFGTEVQDSTFEAEQSSEEESKEESGPECYSGEE